ncbi:MAG: UDP-glucose 4-epimerase GalE [Acidithiobacillus sp.]
MKVLVVGGAGYIGSHMVKRLLQGGAEVIVLDNLSGGYRDAVQGAAFIHGDIADTALLTRICAGQRFDAVMHFASYIQVGESVQEPAKYYQNNLSNTLNLLNMMVILGIKNFIFSSTAAIFGEPKYTPIDEIHPKEPINPYGQSKWMVEQALADYDRAYGLKSVCLRYFNAAGADPEGEMGERHDPETHLIPLVLQTASGRRPHIKIFGKDYDTPDGTCIRDYIHVTDLAEAHWLALEHLRAGGPSAAFNLGNGNGFSVQEVIDVARQVTGRPIACVDEARRAGDPARLVADSRRIREQLGWQPRYDDLHQIIADAWRWETR